MNNPEILLKCHCAHRCRHKHSATRIQVYAVLIGSRERIHNQSDALQRDAIAHGMENRTGEGFDTMGQRIGPGSRCQFRRQSTVSSGSRMTSLARSSG